MKSDSVLNAKAEIFQKEFGYQEVEGPSAQSHEGGAPLFLPREGSEAFHAILKANRGRKREPRELTALGVQSTGGNGNPDGFELAIFVQRKQLIQHPIVEQAQRVARGEAKVVFTGPATRHGPLDVARHRPLRMGISAGHYRLTAGTLGCFARCRRNGGVGILSNNHVLAFTDRGRNGDEILQPSRADGGVRPDDVIASLYRRIPLRFGPGASNSVDCAFAMLNDQIQYQASTVYDRLGADRPLGQIEDLVASQLNVKKFGRTTGPTSGIVVAANVDNLTVDMVPGDPTKFARFDDQLVINGRDGCFSKPGDSGSIIFSETDDLVGLLFAGTKRGSADGSGLTYANPLSKVLNLLDIDIVRS